MKDTLHQLGLNLSDPKNLQSFLESRLRRLSLTDGLTNCSVHWKEKVTPAGLSYCKAVLSVPRTSAKEYFSVLSRWQTPVKCMTNGTTINCLDSAKGMNRRNSRLDHQVLAACLVNGEITKSRLRSMTAKTVFTNPEFLCWLMGYPEQWEESRAMVNGVNKGGR